MNDKLDLRIPAGRSPRMQIEKVLDFCRGNPSTASEMGLLKKTANYSISVDLKECGIPALLHYRCQRGRPNHKLELIETAKMNLETMRQVVKETFADVEPEECGIMRADLTADVEDVEVGWFRRHSYFSHKRVLRQIGYIPSSPWMAVQNAVCETFYAGKAPNQYRTYDKTGEERHRYAREARMEWNKIRKGWKKGSQEVIAACSLAEDGGAWGVQCAAEIWREMVERPLLDRIPYFPTFRERFGHDATDVKTRVERRCQGRDLETLKVQRFEDMKTLHLVEPFRKMHFFHRTELPQMREWTPSDYGCGMYLRSVAESEGMESLRSTLRRLFGEANYRRAWKKFRPFFDQVDARPRVDGARLQLLYEQSTIRQLAA